MIFIMLFVIGVLAVPIAWDISRHGKDNILRRSGRDVVEFSKRRTGMQSVGAVTDRVGSVVLGIGALAILMLLFYLALRLVVFIGSIIF